MITNTIGSINKRYFHSAQTHITLSTGEVIKMLRELKGWTQRDLAAESGLAVSNISLLENNRVDLGKKRAQMLAKAFKVHPAIIMFPEYEGQTTITKVAA